MSRRSWLVAGVATLVMVAAIGTAVVLNSGGATVPTLALGTPRFVEETAAGVEHSYIGGSLYFEGGGVAAFDCSGDGNAELYFAGGEAPAALYLNESEPGRPLSFVELDAPELALDAVTGAYPIDIDGDLVTDLVVLRVGENVVFRGLGACSFERANESWGIDGGEAWTAGFSATWEPGSMSPTLAFGNYLKLTDLTNETDLCEPNVVLRPEGRGYGTPLQLEPSWCSLSLLFSDWNRNGVADLRVTNDRQYNREGEEQLWKMSDDRPAPYTREEGWKMVRIWGMGIASYDVTGDGFPEVYLTSQADNKLQTLADGPASPTYADIAIRRGVTAHRPYTGDNTLPSTAWHPEFDDVNNDGFIDLFVSKGNVDAMPGFTMSDPNNLLIGQPDGTFVDGGEEAGIVHSGRTRGSALVDLNADGLLDLVEVNRVDPVRIWRNVGSGTSEVPEQMGNWIDVMVVATEGGNSYAVGSWIEVDVGGHRMTREITIGGGHSSGQLGSHHFGIGPSGEALVRIVTPSGASSEWATVEAGSIYSLSSPAD